MATYTNNYNLKKPDSTDFVDVQDLNDNADKIDEILIGKANLADGKLPLTELPTHTHGTSDIKDGAITTPKLANSGVTAGTYKSVTVNSKGIVTNGSNPTTLAGYGITNAYTKDQVDELDNSILEGLYSEIENIVETGSGSFANISNNASLRYLLYTYQIVGNFVTLNVKITMDASTGPLTLTSLPITTKKTTCGSCVSSANVLCKWTISNNTLEIKKSDSTGMWSHNSGETINFIATYEI